MTPDNALDERHDPTGRGSAPPTPAIAGREWDVVCGDGPVVATAIHDGHAIRPSLQPLLALADEVRRREEDPLTGLFTSVGDVRIRVHTSRFEMDLNRPRDQALYARPEDCWGLCVWREPLPEAERECSLAAWDRYYAMIRTLLDARIARWGCVLLLDLHSYNHRRDGCDAAPAGQAGNPDIELGFTTFDQARWGGVAERFTDVLRAPRADGTRPDVRANVRFPTGGHFPEWVYAHWGERVCTISPEYKKTFMDEWTGQADIAALEAVRDNLQAAVDAVRPDFLACR